LITACTVLLIPTVRIVQTEVAAGLLASADFHGSRHRRAPTASASGTANALVTAAAFARGLDPHRRSEPSRLAGRTMRANRWPTLSLAASIRFFDRNLQEPG